MTSADDASTPTAEPVRAALGTARRAGGRAPLASATAAGTAPPAGVAVTLGELLVAGAVLLLGLVAWAGLALAHAGHWTVAGALGGGAAAFAAVAAAIWRLPALRPAAVAIDRAELAVLALLAVVAAWLCFPGFAYGVGDKDPGKYVTHATSIARTGSWRVADPVLDRSRVPAFQPASPGARLPGLWYTTPDDGYVTVQFYHLWPAALAVGWALAGPSGLVLVGPLCAVLAVLAVALAVRRAWPPDLGRGRARRWAPLAAGGLAGLLLATNMLEVWQAKYPSAEIITQVLVAVSALGLMVSLRTGWRPAAGLAGLLLGLSWLARADSLLLVLIAVGVASTLIALGRADARLAWFGAGLLLVTPHALLQAYHFAARYTLTNGVPGLPLVAALVLGSLAAAFALRRLAAGPLDRLAAALGARRTQLAIGLLVSAVAGAALVLGFLRPRLFGPAYWNYHGHLIRSYAEQTMRRLAWFLTFPGIALAGLGVALVALRRWSAAAWLAAMPVLLVFPVYAAAAENSSRLLWWSRRFVPVVLPGLLAMAALALVAALAWDGRARLALPPRLAPWAGRLTGLVAGLVALGMVAVFASQSLPLRHHDEYGGSFAITDQLAATAGGRQGVFLIGRGPGAGPTAFAAPLWLERGQIAVLLPPTQSAAYVESFARGFPGQPVLLLTPGPDRPPGYERLDLRRVEHVTGALPMWDESDDRRPDKAHLERVDLSVWHLAGT